MGIHMAHYNIKRASPLLEDSLCTVRLHGSPRPLPSRPLLASFHSGCSPPPPRVFIDLMADLASPSRRLPPSQQHASPPSFLASASWAERSVGLSASCYLVSRRSDCPSWVCSLARSWRSCVSSDTGWLPISGAGKGFWTLRFNRLISDFSLRCLLWHEFLGCYCCKPRSRSY